MGIVGFTLINLDIGQLKPSGLDAKKQISINENVQIKKINQSSKISDSNFSGLEIVAYKEIKEMAKHIENKRQIDSRKRQYCEDICHSACLL